MTMGLHALKCIKPTWGTTFKMRDPMLFLPGCLGRHREQHSNRLDREVHDQHTTSADMDVLHRGKATRVPKTGIWGKLGKMCEATPGVLFVFGLSLIHI